MKNNDELLEQMIKDEFEKAAKEEVTLLEDDNIHVPAGMKEALYLKISSKIEEFDKIEVETAEEEKEEKGEGRERRGKRGERGWVNRSGWPRS